MAARLTISAGAQYLVTPVHSRHQIDICVTSHTILSTDPIHSTEYLVPANLLR